MNDFLKKSKGPSESMWTRYEGLFLVRSKKLNVLMSHKPQIKERCCTSTFFGDFRTKKSCYGSANKQYALISPEKSFRQSAKDCPDRRAVQ